MNEQQTSDAAGDPHEAGLAEKAGKQLERLVAKVIDEGVGPVTGAITWAEDRLARVRKQERARRGAGSTGASQDSGASTEAEIEKTIRRLIRESVEAAGVNGFVTGLGGFVAMPVTVPANMAGALVINARLTAAIAHLRGYDLRDPHVQTVITLVALGSNAQQVAKTVGVKVGEKMLMQAIKKLPVAVIRQVNKKAGITLLAKYGTQRSAITLAKGVPLVGGLVGAPVDAITTNLVGRTAKLMFAPEHGMG